MQLFVLLCGTCFSVLSSYFDLSVQYFLLRNQQAAGSSPASSSKNTAMQRCNFVMQIAVFFCILFVHTRKTAVETVIRFLPLSDCHLSMQTLFRDSVHEVYNIFLQLHDNC